MTFNRNGNTISDESKSCTIRNNNTTCSITSPTITAPSGFSVVGYSTAASTHTSSWNQNTAKNVSDNATYYAISRSTGYYLTLDAGNGTIGTATGFTKSSDNRTATKLLLTGSAYGELPTASREGAAEFLGWYNSAGTKVSASTTMGSSSVTLYAKYKCSKQIHSEGACDSGTCFSQLYYEGGSASDYFGYSHPVYTGGACICYWNCG